MYTESNMNGSNFMKTLKVLGFPECEKYSASDFDEFFSDPQLQQFLDYVCTFNEGNVLTIEELNAYAAIPPEELAELEKLVNEEKSHVNKQAEDDKEEEAEYLKDQLAHLDKQHTAMLKQKELLKEHQTVLLNEKEEYKNAILHLKRNYDDYTLNRIPLAEAELFATLQSIFEVITELKTWNSKSGDKNVLSCVSSNIEDYFEEEKKIIHNIEASIRNNFQFRNKESLELNLPIISVENLLKEVLIIENVLKTSKLSELQLLCDYGKKKTVKNFFKNYDTGVYPQVTDASSALLSVKLSEELQENKKLKQKETQLMSYVSDAISSYIKAQCSEIIIAHSSDSLSAYRHYMKIIEYPLQHMLHQRSRLELLISIMSSNQRNLKNMRLTIKKIVDFLTVEEKELLERKESLRELCDKISFRDNNLSQSSILLPCSKILNAQNGSVDHITLDEIAYEIEQLFKQKSIFVEQKEDKINAIKSLENHYFDMTKYVSKGKEFSKFMKLGKSFSSQMNQLDLLTSEMHAVFSEFQNYWTDQNKLLETKKNLKLMRSMFILALLDEKKFEEGIKKIKKACENSVTFNT